MLCQAWRYGSPHWIENKIDAFPSSQFGGRNEVGITGKQDDLINLLLVVLTLVEN